MPIVEGLSGKPYLYYFWSSIAIMLFVIKFVFSRTRKRHLLKEARKKKGLYHMKWDTFEKFSAQYFRELGYKVHEFGGNQADGGIDLIITRKKEKVAVQVKHYSPKNKVAVNIVREMLGVFNSGKESMKLTGVMIITSSTFTKPAIEFAEQNNITIIDGHQIIKKIG
jgi:restriction system protein